MQKAGRGFILPDLREKLENRNCKEMRTVVARVGFRPTTRG